MELIQHDATLQEVKKIQSTRPSPISRRTWHRTMHEARRGRRLDGGLGGNHSSRTRLQMHHDRSSRISSPLQLCSQLISYASDEVREKTIHEKIQILRILDSAQLSSAERRLVTTMNRLVSRHQTTTHETSEQPPEDSFSHFAVQCIFHHTPTRLREIQRTRRWEYRIQRVAHGRRCFIPKISEHASRKWTYSTTQQHRREKRDFSHRVRIHRRNSIRDEIKL